MISKNLLLAITITSILILVCLMGCGSSGVGGGGDPLPTPTPTPIPVDDFISTSTLVLKHSHNITITFDEFINSETGIVYKSSKADDDHYHQVDVTLADFESLRAGGNVSIISSIDEGHNHNWNIIGGLFRESDTVDGHYHNAVILYTDIGEPPADGAEFISSNVLGHTHTLSFTQEELATLKDGGQITKTSSEADGHTHTWVVSR